MHELALAMAVVDLVEQQRRAEDFTAVRKLFLSVGTLSCVEPRALRTCMEAAVRGTVAEGAEITIAMEAGRARCPGCGHEMAVESMLDPCARCGRFGLDIVAGKALRLTELEVT